jgi:hypothetical protein
MPGCSPEGRYDNSPAFQGWVRTSENPLSPAGTADFNPKPFVVLDAMFPSAVPVGTYAIVKSRSPIPLAALGETSYSRIIPSGMRILAALGETPALPDRLSHRASGDSVFPPSGRIRRSRGSSP